MHQTVQGSVHTLLSCASHNTIPNPPRFLQGLVWSTDSTLTAVYVHVSDFASRGVSAPAGVRVFLTPGLEAHLKRQKLNGKLDAIRSLVPLCQGTLLDRLPDTHATSMDTHQHADGAGLKQETSGVQDSPSHTQRKKRLKTASASAPAAASTQAIPGGGNVGVPVGGAHCGDVTGEVAAGTSGDVTATVAASGLLVVGCKDDNSRRAGIAPGTCVWGEETLIRSVLCSEKLWERPGEKPLFVSRQYG